MALKGNRGSSLIPSVAITSLLWSLVNCSAHSEATLRLCLPSTAATQPIRATPPLGQPGPWSPREGCEQVHPTLCGVKNSPDNCEEVARPPSPICNCMHACCLFSQLPMGMEKQTILYQGQQFLAKAVSVTVGSPTGDMGPSLGFVPVARKPQGCLQHPWVPMGDAGQAHKAAKSAIPNTARCLTPFENAIHFLSCFFSFLSKPRSFCYQPSLCVSLKGGGREGIWLVQLPFSCHLPHWCRQEASEDKKCPLLHSSVLGNLILVWCLDSNAEESINENEAPNFRRFCLTASQLPSPKMEPSLWVFRGLAFAGALEGFVLFSFGLQQADDLICVCTHHVLV